MLGAAISPVGTTPAGRRAEAPYRDRSDDNAGRMDRRLGATGEAEATGREMAKAGAGRQGGRSDVPGPGNRKQPSVVMGAQVAVIRRNPMGEAT
jgi:hypothetical protein